MLTAEQAKIRVKTATADMRASKLPLVPEHGAELARAAQADGDFFLAAEWYMAAAHVSAGQSRAEMYERLAGECLNAARAASPARANSYLSGANRKPHNGTDARALVGAHIKYLRKADIDHSGRGYFFPRAGDVVGVSRRGLSIDHEDNVVTWQELVEVEVLTEPPRPKYLVGDTVRLLPTQGGYQKPLSGMVTSVTPKLVGVTRDGARHEVRFRQSDGYPVSRMDREFPCYVVKPMEV